MQQSGYDEMQLLQQQVMIKQLQDLQRQQQLQQQNYLNSFSPVHKQNHSGQFSPLVDGTPLDDASQGYINWVQRDTSPAQQGTQNRALFSMEFSPQQLDVSLYGTPLGCTRGNISQHSTFQAMYMDPVNLFTKPVGQPQKYVMQLSDFDNPFPKDQYKLPQDQVSMPQGAFMSSQIFQGKNILGAGPARLNSGPISGNLPMGNNQQGNVSPRDTNTRQERAGWSEMQQKATKPSQGLVPLDPLEEKILFSMEENNFSDIGSCAFGNTFDSTDFSNAFPSIQSGSWSALMQSAVAEASTGMQEEWSGLTFQNTEPLADNNRQSIFIDSDKQQTAWVNNSLPSSISPSFEQQKDGIIGMYQDVTQESALKSPKVISHWVDHAALQKPFMEANQQVQSHVRLNDSQVRNLDSLSNSFQPMTPVHDMSQRASLNNISGPPRNAGMSFPFNLQLSSAASFLSGPMHSKKGSQVQMMSPAASQSADISQPSVTLDGEPGSQLSVISSKSQRLEVAARPFNVWTDLPTQQPTFDEESLKAPLNSSSSVDVLGNNVTNLAKVQQIATAVYNAPQRVGLHHAQEDLTEHFSGASTPLSDSSRVHSVSDNQHQDVSDGNIAFGSLSLEPANLFPQSNSIIHQLQATNNTETDPSKKDQKIEMTPDIQRMAAMTEQKSHEHNSMFKMPAVSVPNSTLQLNRFAISDIKEPSLMEARRKESINALLPNLLPDLPSSGVFGSDHYHSQGLFNNSNVVSGDIEHDRINQHASGPSWLKKFGTLRNGQVLPVDDSTKIAGGQLSLGKSSDNRHAQAHIEQEDHDAEDANAGTSDSMNQDMAIIMQKKRKLVIPEQLAWNKQISQGSQKHQRISGAGREWAQATNWLFEKVEGEVYTIEQPVARSKRRLVLTTQLMQQLLRPAPAFILSADVTVNYDSISYFIARATLGDACSLTHGGRNALSSPSYEAGMISGQLNTFERTVHEQYAEVIEGLIKKAEKLESDFRRYRLEKAASIADTRLELQDLERFSVINRFARFHSRAQVDTSGNMLPSSIPRPMHQRYVTAVPLPRNLPEGAQCLSL